MSRTARVLLAAVLLLAAAGGLLLLHQRDEAPEVVGFEACAEAGHDVLEGPPRRCRTPDGRTFVEGGEPAPGGDEVPDAAVTDSRVRVSSPRPNAVVSSPLAVSGSARGAWFFEADFPVRLLDGDGRELSVAPARAQGEWMSEDFVRFEATVTFGQPATRTGVLVLDRSNPSGLAENAALVSLPVRFVASAPRRRVVRVFFNRTGSGDDACDAVWPVARAVDPERADAGGVLAELLAGPAPAERDRGFLTNIPEGVQLRSLRMGNGTAHADFDRTLDRAAGSCRVLAVRAQIERTLLQLPGVDEVVISVEGDVEEALQP
jgi:hypothetical protein